MKGIVLAATPAVIPDTSIANPIRRLFFACVYMAASAIIFAHLAFAQTPPPPCQPMPHCAQGYVDGPFTGQRPPGPPPRPTHHWVEVAMAVAIHPEANDVWAIWDSSDRLGDVKKDVLVACERTMGSSCSLTAWGTAGTIVIAKSRQGLLWVGWGDDPRQATKHALKNCTDGSKQECSVFRLFNSEHWLKRHSSREPDRKKTYFPSATTAIPKMAVVAWPETTPANPKWHNKIWVSTGVSGWSNASNGVTDKCSRDSGTPCTTGSSSFGGVVLRYSTERDANAFLVASSRNAAQSTMDASCKIRKMRCKLRDIFDSQTNAMLVVDDIAYTDRID